MLKGEIMSLSTSVIDSAISGRYTELSNSIKANLHDKLNDHTEVQSFKNEYEKIQNLKVAFSNINKPEE